MSVWDIWFTYKGRVARRDWWLKAVLPIFAMQYFLVGGVFLSGLPWQLVFVALPLVYPLIPASVKRLHDHNMHGIYLFLALVPVLGWLWAVVLLGMMEGTEGGNGYGLDPLPPRERFRPLAP